EYAATTAIIAAGEGMVIICAEVDLSAGMVLPLGPFVVYFAHPAGIPFFPRTGRHPLCGRDSARADRRSTGWNYQWVYHCGAADSVIHHHSRHAVYDQWVYADHLKRLS